MKALKTVFTAGLCLLSQSLLAANPLKGWYAGLVFGGAYPNGVHFTATNPFTNMPVSNTLSYSLGGSIGGQLGYRCDQFRVEIEGLFNSDPYSKLTIGDNLVIKRYDTAIGGIPVHLKGNTQIYTGILNGYYDFYQMDSEMNFVPYVGLGVGYAYTSNQFKLYNFGEPVFYTDKTNSSALGQAIVGAQYFVDDTVSVGLDYRFIALSNLGIQNSSTNHFFLNTLNLSFNFAFESDLGIS